MLQDAVVARKPSGILTHSSPSAKFGRALADAAEQFRALAQTLRSIDGVTEVIQDCLISRQHRQEDRISFDKGTGFGIDWYTDAEFKDGRALSFAVEVSWFEGEWIIRPSIRMNDLSGQDDVLELAERYAVDDEEFIAELLGATQAVINAKDEALHQFKTTGNQK